MNIGIIFYFLGWVLNIEAVLMLLPCVISLIYGDGRLTAFLSVMAMCLVIGWVTTHKRPQNSVFYACLWPEAATPCTSCGRRARGLRWVN